MIPKDTRPRSGEFRDERAASILIHLAGEYIAREAGRTTLITPTRANISKDRKNATVYVSVFPENEKEHALAFLLRQRDEFRDYLKKEGRFSVIPRVQFEFDYGEQNRQHLDELSKKM
jgi:ribosome-binding factor A